MNTEIQHNTEIKQGERFEFGANWLDFLAVIDESRIAEAQRSLTAMLGLDNLIGRRFLDIGCGSGLFSLAAQRLGAQVYSFDYDPKSVACANHLKQQYAPDSDWTIRTGSILDSDFIDQLGQFDVIYSWGVLHHTGQMWRAFANTVPLVAEGGLLFISIYNDQGGKSRRWRKVKQLYCSSRLGRYLVKAVFYPYFACGRLLVDVLQQRNPLQSYSDYKKSRGMSVLHDWADWLGGYPFEVAKPEEIFDFYRKHQFEMIKLKTCAGSLGCNEFVFLKK